MSPEQLKNIGINSDTILKLPIEEETDAFDDENDDSEPVSEEIFGISSPDAEAAAAYAAYMKKKAQISAASVSASAKTKDSKLSVQDLPKFEQPKAEETVKVEETAKLVEETKPEGVKKPEETEKTEEGKTAEEAAKPEESEKAEEVKKTEEPAKPEESEKAEEGKTAEEAAKPAEETKVEETKAEETKEPEEAEKAEEGKKTEEETKPAEEAKPEETKSEEAKAEETKKPKEAEDTTKDSFDREEEDSERRTWIMIAIAAGVVLLAVLAYILIWGRKGNNDPGSETNDPATTIAGETGSESAPAETDEPSSEELNTETTSGLIEDTEDYSVEYKIDDARESVLELMKTYYDATADCDVTAIRNCYYDPEAILIDENTLKRKAQIIDGYRGIKCYEAAGLNTDEMVLYVLYEIKFKEVQTPAPTLIRFYLKKSGDEWKIYNGPMSEELHDHLNKMTNNRDVISLMVQVNRAFSQACDRDDELGRLIRLLGEEPETDTQAGAGVSDAETTAAEPDAV